MLTTKRFFFFIILLFSLLIFIYATVLFSYYSFQVIFQCIVLCCFFFMVFYVIKILMALLIKKWPVADPDFELRGRGGGLFYLPCRLSFLQSFLLFSPKIRREGAGEAAGPSPRSATGLCIASFPWKPLSHSFVWSLAFQWVQNG